MSFVEAPPRTATQPYQWLSTAVTDPDTGLEAAFAVYPSAYRLDPQGRLRPIPELQHLDPFRLGFVDTGGIAHLPPSNQTNEGTWIRCIAATLEPGLLPLEEDAFGDLRWTQHVGDIDVPAPVMRFAKYLFEQQIIPFRRSPIVGQSLARLVSSGTGAGVGGALGVYEGLGHGLLLIVTAPGGMLIGGSAMGVATALEKGLHEKVLRMIVPPDDGLASSAADGPIPVESAASVTKLGADWPNKRRRRGKGKGKG